MSNTITALDPTFTTLVNNLMTIERQPLDRLNTQRDTITVQKSIYTDLKSSLDTLQDSVQAMLSTDPFYSFQTGYKTQVSGVSDGTTILTASATSKAVSATYDVSVESLAAAHRVRSDRQTSITQALNMSGSFRIGLGGVNGQETKKTVSGTTTGFATGSVATGQTELGTGAYYVETRKDQALGWQFRMVDQSGKAVAINNSADGSWQAIPAASGSPVTFDTGRGLKITFDADPANYKETSFASSANPAAQVNYSASYASVDVKATDSLADIVYKINNKTTFPKDKNVTATIIDNQLVLTGGSTGASNLISVKDDSGAILKQLGILKDDGTYKNSMQDPNDAVFYVNKLKVQRSANTNLTDVINGVTLNLASDAKPSITADGPVNKTATLDVVRDSTAEKDTLNTFIKNFNSVMKTLTAKIATVKQADGTYKRGALAGDSMFSSLRQNLMMSFNKNFTSGGEYHTLSDLGLSMGNDFQISIADSSKLEKALINKSDFTTVMDQYLNQVNAELGKFTGSSGYVKITSDSLDRQLDNTNDQISNMNIRLDARQEALIQQYAQIQTQLSSMTYLQQQMGAIYSGS